MYPKTVEIDSMQGGKRIPCYSAVPQNYTVVGRWFAPATVCSLSFPLQQLFLSVHYRNRTYLTSKTNLPNLCGLSCATGKTTLGPFRTTELSLSLKVVWGVSNREAQKWSRVLSFQFCLCFQKRKKKLETQGLNKQVLWLAVRKVDSIVCNTVTCWGSWYSLSNLHGVNLHCFRPHGRRERKNGVQKCVFREKLTLDTLSAHTQR